MSSRSLTAFVPPALPRSVIRSELRLLQSQRRLRRLLLRNSSCGLDGAIIFRRPANIFLCRVLDSERMITNKPATYRPNPRWRVTAAFTTAVAIHLSAVALASLRHETPIVDSGPGFPTIEVLPDTGSAPSPNEAFERPLVSPTVPPELVPSPQPISRRQPVAPIRIPTSRPIGVAGNPRAAALFAPRPEYPYEARSRRLTGSGTAVLRIDSETGLVEGVSMKQSIGHPVLDDAAITAFKRWRFRTGTVRTVRVPITFNLAGAQF